MSVKGIDAQIMISRLPDNARDTSALQKRPEVWQDLLGAQGRVNDAHSQASVAKTSGSEMEAIRTDVEEGGSAGGDVGEGGHGHKKHDQDDDLKPGTLVPSEKHLIDIKV